MTRGEKRKEILFFPGPFIGSSNPTLDSAVEETLHEKREYSAKQESPVKQILSVSRQGHISVIISAYFFVVISQSSILLGLASLTAPLFFFLI